MEARLYSLLKLALKSKASDIHLTLKDNSTIIEMRVDNKLKKVKSLSGDEKLIRYLQYISKMDIGNNLKPQTGQFNFFVDDSFLSLRFAFVCNLNVVNGVIRILNTCLKLSINDLGSEKSDVQKFKKILEYRDGLIIFSGATGSGKTTSLYTILDSFKDKKIITIEDPIEVYKEKYLQLQINEVSGFNYNQAIKQILRHDPDIIMIGEIRDEIAANAALRAANTGHLVICTIHAQSSVMAINRLIDLGIEKHNLKSVLKMVFNQRLFKTCSHRKVGVYEVLDGDVLLYFFEKNMLPKNFETIERKVQKAFKNKTIINI